MRRKPHPLYVLMTRLVAVAAAEAGLRYNRCTRNGRLRLGSGGIGDQQIEQPCRKASGDRTPRMAKLASASPDGEIVLASTRLAAAGLDSVACDLRQPHYGASPRGGQPERCPQSLTGPVESS